MKDMINNQFRLWISSKGGSISNVLLKATVTIQPNSVCASQYSNFVAADMLCASAAGKDTCQVNDSSFQRIFRFIIIIIQFSISNIFDYP